MKNSLLISIFVLLSSFIAQAQVASLCTEPSQAPEWCNRMKHLRATVNTLDSQRELMQADYSFLSLMGTSMKDNTTVLLTIVPAKVADHSVGIQSIRQMAIELEKLAKDKNPDALVTANQIRGQCLNCHNSSNPGVSAGAWNDVFRFDWVTVSKNCSLEGRNPYLCKSMNAMMTDYNHILTAYIAGVKDYAVTGAVALEVVRVLQDLKAKNFLHLGEANRQEAEARASEIADLAKAQDPLTFEKARDLTVTCMKCHEQINFQNSQISAYMNSWGHRL
jgi:hypothetical protein